MPTDLPTNGVPRNAWRVLGFSAVLLLIITVTAIGFISAGFFDPKPVGEFLVELPLQTITVEANQETFTWLDYDLTAESFSLRLTAAYESGDVDNGYGLALGNESQALLIALSSTGYTTIQEQLLETGLPSGNDFDSSTDELDNMIANGSLTTSPLSAAVTPILEWQPWPHINAGTETNEIWLDQKDQTITVRINRELLWTGPSPFSPSLVGLWLAAFNDDVTVNFQTLSIYRD